MILFSLYQSTGIYSGKNKDESILLFSSIIKGRITDDLVNNTLMAELQTYRFVISRLIYFIKLYEQGKSPSEILYLQLNENSENSKAIYQKILSLNLNIDECLKILSEIFINLKKNRITLNFALDEAHLFEESTFQKK